MKICTRKPEYLAEVMEIFIAILIRSRNGKK
jgi:hypothetical protein